MRIEVYRKRGVVAFGYKVYVIGWIRIGLRVGVQPCNSQKLDIKITDCIKAPPVPGGPIFFLF